MTVQYATLNGGVSTVQIDDTGEETRAGIDQYTGEQIRVRWSGVRWVQVEEQPATSR